MALDSTKRGVVEAYSSLCQFEDRNVAQDYQRLVLYLHHLSEMIPQEVDRPPLKPRSGMIRKAIYPGWAPLGGSSDVWVQFDGSDWVAFP